MKTASSFELESGGKTLRLIWDDGTSRVIPAGLLWVQCPSALGRRQRMDGKRTVAPAGIAIAALNPVGSYGLNIVFSDGHDRGIYPWPYLDGIELPLQPADFIIN